MIHLKEKYQKEVIPKMKEKFGFGNDLAVPQIEKVVVNVGFGRQMAGKSSEERKKIYSEIQKILAEELPYIFLWYPHNIVVMNEKLQGFTLYPDGDFASLQNMWFEE